jgi:hypothetical protein
MAHHILPEPEPEDQQPQVTWTLDLDDAEELWEFLHHHRPGGYQHVSDGLREAISETKFEVEG